MLPRTHPTYVALLEVTLKTGAWLHSVTLSLSDIKFCHLSLCSFLPRTVCMFTSLQSHRLSELRFITYMIPAVRLCVITPCQTRCNRIVKGFNGGKSMPLETSGCTEYLATFL